MLSCWFSLVSVMSALISQWKAGFSILVHITCVPTHHHLLLTFFMWCWSLQNTWSCEINGCNESNNHTLCNQWVIDECWPCSGSGLITTHCWQTLRMPEPPFFVVVVTAGVAVHSSELWFRCGILQDCEIPHLNHNSNAAYLNVYTHII